jgi:hypothetical protein
MINVVAIHWKMQQQKCIATHSTDSETRGIFAGTKQGMYLQDIASFTSIPCGLYCPMPIYVDSQPAIDTCNANTMSSNAKHIAVPILYIHEQIKKNKIEL